ncbi:hypothetical protein ACHAXA_007495 [Cyclostephanos tholiformis]|uniref:Uncharacterized protein n=1 Tax=Cyclostephanos tholiformis TaxID=382380 RepID=A0ABD3RT41_9STRA
MTIRPLRPRSRRTPHPFTHATMMSSINSVAAVVLLLQALASASAFMPPPKNSPSIKTTDLSKSGLGGFDVIAKTNKKFIEGSAPIPKGGVIGAKKVVTSPPPKKVTVVAPSKKVAAVAPPKKVAAVASPKKVAVVTKGDMKNNVASVGKDARKGAKSPRSADETSDPTKTPWSTILLSFLIPWRNPNSIFLYMLLAVSILGKMNEHP